MRSILAKIKPSTKEQKNYLQIAQTFISKLQKQTIAKVILGGSAKKGTIISGNHDIDLFVAYPSGTKDLSKKLQKSLKKAFPKQKIERLHGSRDYFQTNYKNFTLEIVPIIEIKKAELAENITDISPLHAQWVNKKATNQIKDDIRLLKQFCKANKLYGAESFISGFSGYILEILAIHYGSLNAVFKSAQKWKKRQIVDPEKYYKKDMALFHINTSKLNSPLVIVDPVDKSRNAAAALSREKYNIFIKLAKNYLKKPEEKYFIKDELNLTNLKKKNAIILEVIPKKGKHDVVGMKLVKIFEYIKKEINPFGIKQADWEWQEEKAIFYYVTTRNKLLLETIRTGPPAKLKEHVKDFKKKNKKTFVENGRIKAKIKTEHPERSDFVNDLITHIYIKERIKKIKVI
jgi:tRNA nucleotidyltransferase (CCA-adding enzyme)